MANKFITTNRIGTTTEWQTWQQKFPTERIPEGELIIEEITGENGNVIERKIKVGTGKSDGSFANLPYINGGLEILANSLNTTVSELEARLDQLTTSDTPIPDNPNDETNFGTVEDELSDARIGHDGTKYNNVGNHLRTVSLELETLSDELSDFKNANRVAGLYYDTEDYSLYLVDANGELILDSAVTIVSGSGGDGSGSAATTRLTNKMSSLMQTVMSSVSTELKMSFYEKVDGEYTTAKGRLKVFYKKDSYEDDDWRPLTLTEEEALVEPQVIFSLPIPPSILDELNKVVKVKVSVIGGEYGEESRALTYELTPVDGRIEVDFEDTLKSGKVFEGTFSVDYRCYGKDLEKTAYFEIDDQIVATESLGSLNGVGGTKNIELYGFSHGSHKLYVYFKTDQGTKSNIEEFDILYAAPGSRGTILTAKSLSKKVLSGNPINLVYKLYTPNNTSGLTPNLIIKVYDEKTTYFIETAQNIDEKVKEYSIPQEKYRVQKGKVYISFESNEKLLQILEVEIEENKNNYDVNQVSSGLVYSYKSNSINKESSERDEYKYLYKYDSQSIETEIKAINTNFNWKSNGFMTDASSNEQYLRLMGPARHTVKLPIFTSTYIDDNGNEVRLDSENDQSIVGSGRTIEITFKLSNVSDINAKVIRYYDKTTGIGLYVTPVYAALLYKGAAIITDNRTGFIKNEEAIPCCYIQQGKKIRLSLVIDRLGTVRNDEANPKISDQAINFYINGEFAQSIFYSNSSGMFNSEGLLEIGDDSCITDVYEVRMYRQSLKPEQILQNYNASFTEISEKLENIKENDLLIDDSREGTVGDISYYKARNKYPCVLVTGGLSPNKEISSKSAFMFTKPEIDVDGKESYKVEFDLSDKESSDNNWACYNKVQGTSSVKFPVKNYKFYLRKVVMTEKANEETGQIETKEEVKKVKYSLKGKDANGKDLSIPVSTLCWKADYMSSDHANTFNANIADKLFDIDTIAQQNNPLIQNTIWGFRCLVFQREDENSIIKFIGDGCLNNDKGNTEVFGLEDENDKDNNTLKQKWEFSNNTEKICTWESDALLAINPENNSYNVLKALESSYPDQGDLEEEGLLPDFTAIQLVFTWLVQRANYWDEVDPEKRATKREIFKNEFTRHFNKHRAMTYYLFMEFIGLCDNRAKNLFIRTENCKNIKIIRAAGQGNIGDVIPYDQILIELYKDNDGNPQQTPNVEIINWEESTFPVWITDLYDLDSGFGVENNGYIHIPYYGEWDHYLYGNDLERLDYKFNGKNSRLWLMLEDVFAEDIKNEFDKLSQKATGLNYNSIYNEHIANNALLIAQNVINKDMITKYSDPWEKGFYNPTIKDENNPESPLGKFVHDKTYKYLQRGSRTAQKIEYLRDRSNMLSSKYSSKQYIDNTNNAFSFRTLVAIDESNCWLDIKYNKALYPSYRFGDSGTVVRKDKYIPGEFNKTLYYNNFENNIELNNSDEFNNFELELFKKDKDAPTFSVINAKSINDGNTYWKKRIELGELVGNDIFSFKTKLFIQDSNNIKNNTLFSINDESILFVDENALINFATIDSKAATNDKLENVFVDVEINIEKEKTENNTSIILKDESGNEILSSNIHIDIEDDVEITFGSLNSRFVSNSFKIAYLMVSHLAPAENNKVLAKNIGGMGNSDGVYIYGPTTITEINNISSFYPYEIKLENMTNLKSLVIGNKDNPDYTNNAASFSPNLSNCKILENLDISGIANMTELSLANNFLLKTFYAKRTNKLNKIDFPQGGALEEAYIGDIQDISLVDLPNLRVFECSGYENTNTIRIENCPNINSIKLLETRDTSGTKLIRKPLNAFRLVGFSYQVENDNVEILEDLNNDEYCYGKFMDADGISDKASYKKMYPYLKGEIIYNGKILETGSPLTSKLFGELRSKYPDLQIKGFTELHSKLIIYNADGSIFKNEVLVSRNGNAGSTVINRILNKDSSPEFNYEYIGLSRDPEDETPEFPIVYDSEKEQYITPITNIFGETKLYPIYKKNPRYYNVRFFNGTEQLGGTLKVQYGHNAEYPGDTTLLRKPGDIPSKDENGNDVYAYEFYRWKPSPENITSDRDCYAQFDFTNSNYFEVPETHLNYEILSDTDESRTMRITKYITVEGVESNQTIARIQPSYTLDRNNDGEINEDDQPLYEYKVTEILGNGSDDPENENNGFTTSGVAVVNLPEGLEVIGKKSFFDCYDLNIVNIPSTVTTIGPSAFEGCLNIEKIEYNAKDLKNVEFEYDNSNIAHHPFYKVYNEHGFDLYISEDVLQIPNNLFFSTTSPSSVYNRMINDLIFKKDEYGDSKCTVIGSGSFSKCNPNTIVFPNKLQKISSEAFSGNYNIETLDLSGLEDLKTIESRAFRDWPNLKTLKLPPNLEKFGNEGSDNVFMGDATLQNIENIIMTPSIGSKFSVITHNIEGKNLGHTLLKEDLTGNKTVVLGTKNSIISSADINKIGSYSFQGVNLVSYEIPGNIKSIESGAFSGCDNLETIIFNQGIEEIKNNVFTYCKKLSNIKFNNVSSLKTIWGGAFFQSTANKLIIPESCDTFYSSAFSTMYNLEVLVLRTKNIPDFKSTATIGYEKDENGRPIINKPIDGYNLFEPIDFFTTENSYATKNLKTIYVGWPYRDEETGEIFEINIPPEGFKYPLGIPDFLNVKIVYGFDGTDDEAVVQELEE